MRGIIRYGPDPVVAILDSQRAGESTTGIPIVGTVDDALRSSRRSPSWALRRRAAGSRRRGATC